MSFLGSVPGKNLSTPRSSSGSHNHRVVQGLSDRRRGSVDPGGHLGSQGDRGLSPRGGRSESLISQSERTYFLQSIDHQRFGGRDDSERRTLKYGYRTQL